MYSQKEYVELLKQFPPRPIKSEKDLEETQARVNYLLYKPKNIMAALREHIMNSPSEFYHNS
ncbi:hypothetical protein [Crocosphaera chwakensis]|uniref:Uncharacterized protein n=1 Tax=Crocosphaera chwakensis CCY0110 TaxID=391612 RepID=A3INQ6_9CHRO|nr:hypothetical protein [Crocosphaera chwakensis]EAZ91954.1 hypothetical protein CY0110_29804 [Crocosphaera chwakensis CCY0110]